MLEYPIPNFVDMLGQPFLRGGRGPDVWDCYGSARELFRRTGRILPDFETPGKLEEIEHLTAHVVGGPRWHPRPIGTPGTLITFRVDGAGAHVGFMLKNDRFFHCIDGEGCTTEKLTNNWRLRPIASYIYE